MRDEKESGEAKSIAITSDGRAEASGSHAESAARDEVPANVGEARERVRQWRVRSLERQLPAEETASVQS